MSALPPKADISSSLRDVCFVQKQTHALQQSMPDLGEVLANFHQQFARAIGFRDITVATSRTRFVVVAAQP